MAATTRLGLLTTPLRDRFGIPMRLNFYTVEELEQIVRRGARSRHAIGERAGARLPGARAARPASPDGCCGGCATSPAVAGRRPVSSLKIADEALPRLLVDGGLDELDRRYLDEIAQNFGGGPVGIETIAAGFLEPRDAIEDIVEPYLIQQGLSSAPRAAACSRQMRGSIWGWRRRRISRRARSACSRKRIDARWTMRAIP